MMKCTRPHAITTHVHGFVHELLSIGGGSWRSAPCTRTGNLLVCRSVAFRGDYGFTPSLSAKKATPRVASFLVL